ncbi:hypothetical protein V8E52_004340 [Russula decolorans]
MHVAGLTADVKVCLCLISRNCWLALTARCDEGFLLPDDVLIDIFDCFLRKEGTQEWMTLAQVCRLWRSVVFQSPLRLNLQLVCTRTTRARDTLDIWPPLPLIIQYHYNIFGDDTTGVDNIIAALEHNDRVCQIDLEWISSPLWEYLTDSAAMQKPFPELTDLQLSVDKDGSRPILPDSFLGGTAPRLRSLYLDDISFPGLPKLLLSATHLVVLTLYNIPRSGYIPPEVMATSLSALTSLELLCLDFRYPRPRPALGSRRPPPLTRSILPSLTQIRFTGTSEYLEEILARIDAPRLDGLDTTFFNQIIFDTPQFFQFISRRPTLRALKDGHITFNSTAILVEFSSQTRTSDYEILRVRIPCTASEWQLSSLEQGYPPPHWQDDVENTLWLDVLRPFVAVKNLYLSEEFVPRIAPALQELVGGRTTEVLPTLENIFSRMFQPWRPIHKGVERFVAARQLTSHPVAVSSWTQTEKENLREVYSEEVYSEEEDW